MKFRGGETRDRIPELDLISMVDLVFLLIIFFLTTSTFIEKAKAKVDLPVEPGESFQDVKRTSLIVNLTRNETFVVSGEYLTLERLMARIDGEVQALGGDAERLDLVLRADKSASAASLNQLAEKLIVLGVRSWKLATEAPPNARPGPPGGGSG